MLQVQRGIIVWTMLLSLMATIPPADWEVLGYSLLSILTWELYPAGNDPRFLSVNPVPMGLWAIKDSSLWRGTALLNSRD